MGNGERIVQIIPAIGWCGIFADVKTRGMYYEQPVACWGLNRHGEVEGLGGSGRIGSFEQIDQFLGYTIDPKLGRWQERAEFWYDYNIVHKPDEHNDDKTED